MNLLQDVITYVRRLLKTQSDSEITDALIIDYINRFWIMDVDARIQLYDLKTKYKFVTTPGVDRYNMPLYSTQVEPGNQQIGMYPVYQGFINSAYVNGIQVPLQTIDSSFYNIFPNVPQVLNNVATGDGGQTYNFTLPILSTTSTQVSQSILRGHIDISGIIATGNNIDPILSDTAQMPTVLTQVPVTSISAAFYINTTDSTGANMTVTDSGVFLSGDVNYGLLINPGPAPFGHTVLGAYSTTDNTVNYLTGEVNVTFPSSVAAGVPINVQCFYFQTGLPRSILYYNNTLTLRSPPAQQYLVELDAYLTPSAFLNTGAAIPFGYMAEYLSRGAARKMLADLGDIEQFMFYEPLFKEQEMLVWKRSQRQFTNNRSPTIYSQGFGQGFGNTNTTMGGGTI